MKPQRRVLAILAVNGLVLAVGLAGIEIFFGGWMDAANLNRLNLLTDCSFQYDISSLYPDAHPTIQYSRDKYGLRGTHGNPGAIDILTVGGSTTDQRFIRDGETWQDVLQDQYGRSGESVVIANAGLDGQSTYGHIKNFEWWFPNIPGLAPDYILFYVGLNDFHKEAGNAYDRLVKADQRFSLKREIQDRSALCYMARTIRGAFEAMVVKDLMHRHIDFGEVDWTQVPLQRDYDFMDARLNEYAGRLRVLADVTRELGAKPIFVSQPSRYFRVTPTGVAGRGTVMSYDHHPINGVDHYHMLRRLDRVTETVAGEEGAFYIDLGGRTDWIDTDFYDWTHMTPQGAGKVGHRLHAALKNM